ncbi:hypothetical protein ACS5NO_12755 [Larkinella sp. GY13]|uniref:hypothetical protein n=1 Tax=Larkinella sp. GY13 TaxID=3453720 RepID=UPI003EED243A
MTVSPQHFGVDRMQPNAGYVRTLWLLREPDVLAVMEPERVSMTVSPAGLLARVGAVVTRLQPPSRTATFAEPTQSDRAGTMYLPSLQLSLPRPPAELDRYLTDHQAVRWVVFWLDYNGQGWVAGDAGNGLRLTIGRQQSETALINLQLSGKNWHPAWRLATTDLATLFPVVDFDYSFDLSFNS